MMNIIKSLDRDQKLTRKMKERKDNFLLKLAHDTDKMSKLCMMIHKTPSSNFSQTQMKSELHQMACVRIFIASFLIVLTWK